MTKSHYILGDSNNSRRPIIYTGDNSDLIKIANSVKDVRPKNKGKDKPHEQETPSPIIHPNISDLENYIILEGRTHGNFSYEDLLVGMHRLGTNPQVIKAGQELGL
ncbi:MAG: hypothetical protein ACP5OG_06275, partial [Candidatus Nanoarchaeia archaeon]